MEKMLFEKRSHFESQWRPISSFCFIFLNKTAQFLHWKDGSGFYIELVFSEFHSESNQVEKSYFHQKSKAKTMAVLELFLIGRF